MKHQMEQLWFRDKAPRRRAVALRFAVLVLGLFALAATSKALVVRVLAWRDAGETERRVLLDAAAPQNEQIEAVVAIRRRIKADIEALRVAAARGDGIAPHAENALTTVVR